LKNEKKIIRKNRERKRQWSFSITTHKKVRENKSKRQTGKGIFLFGKFYRMKKIKIFFKFGWV